MTLHFQPTATRTAVSAAFAALVLALPAAAQQATPAPVAVAPMTCTKPADFMPTFRSSQELARFQKSLDVYKTCVDQYVQANSTHANQLVAEARAYNDSANEAIKNFNAYMTELNEASKNAGDKPPSTQGGAPKITP